VRRARWSDLAVVGCLAAVSLPAWLPVVIGFGGAVLDRAAWGDLPATAGRAGTLARSGAVALILAALSTLLAGPMAQVLRTAGVRVAALLIAPVWIPSWLIYAGLNLARAPDTVVGRAFMDWALDPDRAVWGDSNRWAIVALGRALAVGALVLWSAPIAALVMAGAGDPEADAAREMARTEPIGVARRAALSLRLGVRPVGLAVGVVFLLTLGSSVPLHLAQVETDAIGLWRALAERSRDRWAGVWLAGWAPLLVALGGAWWVSTRFGRASAPGASATPATRARCGPGVRVAAWGVWSLASVVPVGLMLWSLDSRASLLRWLHAESGALLMTAGIAAAGAVFAAAAGVGVAGAVGSDRAWTRAAGRFVAGLAVFGGLVPGVLVGAAIAGLPEWLGGTPGAVLAAGARTAGIGALAGLVVARSEPPDERAARSLDGAGDALGWLRANRWRAWRLGAGVWLGGFVLALYEIEASVMVRPPGQGNLPQRMLSDLHYARLEQLSAGGAVMGLLGIAAGVAAGLALGIGGSRPQSSPTDRQPGGNAPVGDSV
jgi:ABC-type spermidine/putrescine transport system permease subunit II